MEKYKIHKNHPNFTWSPLCGATPNIKPTQNDSEVTCKTCLRMIREAKTLTLNIIMKGGGIKDKL